MGCFLSFPALDFRDEFEADCDAERQMSDLRRRMASSTSFGLVRRFFNGFLKMAGMAISMVMLQFRSPQRTILNGEIAPKASAVYWMIR